MRGRGESVDWWGELARRKLEAPPDWHWSKLQSVGPDAVIVEGGIPRTLTRGKNKGKRSWSGVKLNQCVITRAEVAAEQQAYETETRLCSACYGGGQESAGWSKEHGSRYRDCDRCKGTGNAREAM